MNRPSAPEEPLAELARWVSDLQGPLPVAARARAVEILLDDLAAAIGAAATEPPVARVADMVARRSRGPARLWATGERVEVGWAAFANAVAACWIELDEGYRIATAHGGLYTLPAVLAEADRLGVTLGDVLRALVAGYEVATRIARAYPARRPPTVHPHASLAAVGAAAGVASLRRMDPGEVVRVIGAAASFAVAGPFDHAVEGLLVRNVWPGLGAWSGLLACDLVPLGIGGAPSGLSEVYGRILGETPEPDAVATALTDGLGSRCAVQDGYRKVYACCQYAHSAVEAVLELRHGPLAGLDPADIQGIEVETHELALTLLDHEPNTVLAAKFSLPHAVAAAAVTGRADVDVFSSARLGDPVVASVRRTVSARPYEPTPQPPIDRPARVTIRLRDGSTHRAESLSSLGSPDRPVSADRALAKLDSLTGDRPRFASTARALINARIPDDVPWHEVGSQLLDLPSGSADDGAVH